jgi:thymidylate synthase
MNNVDKQYKQLLKFILDNGRLKKDRTGTGTISIFDYSIRFKMSRRISSINIKENVYQRRNT